MSSTPTVRSHVLLASAGSGKTFRLTSHFLRLVALGSPPERILASTFTRKAAGEILGRVFSRLAAAAESEKQAAKLGGELDVALTQVAARDLLARLARNVHRFRIRTLDAFFVDLARSISAELGLPPDWSIADDVDLTRARDDAVASALDGAERGPWIALLRELERGDSSRSVHRTLENVIDDGLRLHLEAAPGAWRAPELVEGPDDDAVQAALRDLAGLAPPQTKGGKPDSRWAKEQQRIPVVVQAADWSALIGKGFGKAMLADGRYYKVEIPAEFAGPLRVLLARASAVLGREVRAQNEASARFLELYVERLRGVQEASRRLSFDDVARALGRAGADRRSLHADLALRLDGAIDHLLLDEFQDTSPMQWRVLSGIADELLADGTGSRSFFCVGDVKQSIYGWRAAEPRLLEKLPERLHVKAEPMDESWRSSQVVLDAVNRVFGSLADFEGFKPERGDDVTANEFQGTFRPHLAMRTERAGCVRVSTCAAGANDDERWSACVETAVELVREIRDQTPDATIAVLLRRNRLAPRIVTRLRDAGIAASDEGGNPLTDAVSVQAALAMLHWLEHPADEVARFHASTSALASRWGLASDSDDAAAARVHQRAREDLLEIGLAAWLAASHDDVEKALGAWEARRFGQLVDAALSADVLAPLGDFVERARRLRVEDSSSARVKVMTVHASKGLEFDAVILPELDAPFIGRSDAFVARREDDDPERDFDVVSRSVGADAAALFEANGDDRIQSASTNARRRALRDSLSGLYVAMTRARRRLDLVIWAEGKTNEEPRASAGGLIRHAFGLGFANLAAGAIAATQAGSLDTAEFDAGRHASRPAAPKPGAQPPAPTALRWSAAKRARELERVSPSSLHGVEARDASALFEPSSNAGRRRGVRWHAWFELIEWLDDFRASDDELRAAARRRGAAGDGLEDDLREFRAALGKPGLRALLARPAGECEAWRERRFALVEPGELRIGAFDRVVVARRGGAPASAHLVDFKTDRLAGRELDLLERYRPQLEAYRATLQRMLGLEAAAVRASLFFVDEDRIADL